MLGNDPGSSDPSSDAATSAGPFPPAAQAASPPVIAVAPDAPGVVTQSESPSGRWRWIALGVFVALLLVLTGGIYALGQYNQPRATATQFCGLLKAQDYDSAYAMLSAKLQAAYTSPQFKLANVSLDSAEGIVADCKLASGRNAYNYGFGSERTTVVTVITRARQGTLQGALHLVNQGGWKVDAMDASLLGINLGALHTIVAYCAAMQSQNIDALYALLGPNLRDQMRKSYFGSLAVVQTTLYGKVTACTIESIASGNTDTTTTVTMTLTWWTKGTTSGQLTLDGTSGTWTISKIDDELEGRDLPPIATTLELCDSVARGDFASAYDLTSIAFQRSTTQAQLAEMFALPNGERWDGCALDLMSTYRFIGTQAQLTVTFYHSGALIPGIGQPFALLTLSLVKEGIVWKVDTINLRHS